MEWMLLPFKRYAQFSGRSRRMEYWLYTLFIVIVSIVLSLLDQALGLGGRNSVTATAPTAPGSFGGGFNAGFHGGILASLFALGTFIPSLAVSVRRLHDRDKSGWWILLPLAPYIVGIVLVAMGVGSGSTGMAALGGAFFVIGLVCAIVLLVWFCLPGTPGPNRFGPDPLDPNGGNLEEVFR